VTENKEQTKGLVIVYTGHGKGKTTAALGMCVRAAGYKKRVKIIQFIKGTWKYGEMDGIKMLEPYVQMEQRGKGFVGIVDDKEDISTHIKAAEEAMGYSREAMQSGNYDHLILDEINVALNLKLITLDTVLKLIKDKPENLHLILTGRDAVEEVIEVADLVTEMREIKHPFQKGILAQQGVDY